MPGTKRKGAPAAEANGKQNGKKISAEQGDTADSDPDNFDDDEDLMATALAEEGGDGEEKASSDEEASDGEIHMLSDEDMEGGFEDVAQAETAEAGPSRAKAHPSLYAIPSRDEMSALKNTSELFKSNIFKLKVIERMFGRRMYPS